MPFLGSGQPAHCDASQAEWVGSQALCGLKAAVVRREAIGKWRRREGFAAAPPHQTYLAPGSG